MRALNVEMGHWLIFNAEREVVRCHCGFEADVATDSGYGDSVVDHLLSINLDARDRARDIAVALEQQLARVEALRHNWRRLASEAMDPECREWLTACSSSLTAALDADA